MRPPRGFKGSGARPDERGFVLIGVVMFVLALTILGLSLFNLSSYEAQFLGRSRRSVQTLNDAMSGIEWARMVLGRERKLQAVAPTQSAWPTRPANVVSVEAWQGDTSNTTGNINFTNGGPVGVRVLADDQRGERRMVEIQYQAQVPDVLYRNVIDSYDFIRVIGVDGQNHPRRTTLYGTVRLNSNDLSWMNNLWPPLPGAPVVGGVPFPQVSAFIANHPTGLVPTSTGTGSYTFSATGDVTFFTWVPTTSVVTLYDDSEAGAPPPPVDFNVSGTCVWILPKGMRINRPVRVNGLSSDRLVIVAGKMSGLPNNVPPKEPDGSWIEGIWFFSGLESTQVPVVLVSDAQVVISHGQQTTAPGTANAISIFAKSVYLEGPETANGVSPLNVQRLRHDVDMDVIIDELAGKGALPNLSGGARVFSALPGTWRELDPDYPS